ncbi:Gfo/Idh/MocA family protein, partial [Thermodesulfobacteriota bacterium]
AGVIPADSWIQDREIGGGRIIGEVCHFIDYLSFVNGSMPVSVYAAALKDAQGLNDTVNISLSFENGSIGNISYFANGSKFLPKEYVEIHSMGATLALTDFRQLEVFTNRRDFKKKLISQDKGQKGAVAEFLEFVKKGSPPPISFEEIYTSSLASFKAVESLRTGKAIKIEE